MRFSERIGRRAPKTAIQLDDMDRDLRVALYNIMRVVLIDPLESGRNEVRQRARDTMVHIWDDHFRRPVDAAPQYEDGATKAFRPFFFDGDYLDVYDFVDYVVGFLGSQPLVNALNAALEREVSAYRFVGMQLAPISDSTELASIEEAIQAGDKRFAGAREHLQAALDKLADRQNPDYRNSVKESVSAVEAASSALAGQSKADLKAALKYLETQGQLHGALRAAFEKLYGYTSDADGVRHAIMDEPNIDFADAKFMLVTCAAFVNYLAAKS